MHEAASAAQALSAALKRRFERLRQASMSNMYRTQNDGGAAIGIILELNIDEFMRSKSTKLQTEPHDTPETHQGISQLPPHIHLSLTQRR